jgi:hypothetical protein
MRYAVIKGNLVVNVIEAPEDWKVEGHRLVESNTAGQGDIYNGRKFIRPEPPVPTLTDDQIEFRDATEVEKQALIAKYLGLVP